MTITMCSSAARVLIFGIILPGALVAQNVSIEDIRIPSSTSRRFTLSLDHYASQRTGTTEEIMAFPPSRTFDERNGNTSSRVGLVYDYQQFDENSSNGIYLSLQGTNYGNDNSRSDSSYRNSSKWTRTEVSFSPSINSELYLSPDAYFLRGFLGGTARYYRDKTAFDNSFTLPEQYDAWTLDRKYDIVVGIGGGYGKVRDGQNVYSAVRILQQLEEDSALSRPLRTEEILRISDLMSRRGEYYRLFDRADKYIVRDVVSALRSMGVLRARNFDAYEAVRLVEVIHEGVQYRLTGWKVWGMLEHRSFQTHRERKDYSFSYPEEKFRGKREYLEVLAEYGRPLSLSSHVYGHVNVKMQLSDRRRNIDWEVFGRYSYEATNRLEFYSEIILRRDNGTRWATWDANYQNRYLEERLNVGGILFIEDRIYLNVSGSYWFEQNNSASDNSSIIPRGKHGNYQFLAGVNVRVL